MTPGQRRNLERLLKPRHVAFIGGDDADFAAGQCAAAGFDGPIRGVNPRRRELGGQPCFARVEDLPEPPDAVFVAVPAGKIVETVDALRRIGAGGVVCYTAGFGETGGDGAALEQALTAAAGDLALVGPNCYGLLNLVRSVPLWPYEYGGSRVERGIALVSQSGMLGSNLTMNRRSVPFAYVISAGNQAMLGVEDYLEVLVDDPAVSAVGLYVEELRDIPRFADAAISALNAGIPIVALKAGSSEVGARLTVTHTGSLAGSDELYQALFDRLGIVRVGSPVALLETLKMLTVAGAPGGRRVAAFTCSGGDATMLADLAERNGILFPRPSADTANELAGQLPAIAAVSNPLDYTTPLWGDGARVEAVIGTMLGDGYDAALMVQDYPHPGIGASKERYLVDARAFMSATRTAGLPAAICSGLPENIDSETREMMIEGGVAPLQGIDEAVTAIAGAATWGSLRARTRTSGGTEDLRLAALPALSDSTPSDDAGPLDEWEGKQRLAAAGIPVPDGRLVDAATAPAAAEELGFPVAVKLVSAGLPHKTEAGAVRLGVGSAGEVARAVVAIGESVRAHAPEAARDCFLVERMVDRPIAELLIGIRRDPRFGQAMVLGSGGTLVELVRDSVTLLLPTDRETVSRALSSLKISALLAGHRGRPAGDRAAVVEVVMKLAGFAEAHRNDLAELEINPLLIQPDGVCAVDVLLRMAGSGEEQARSASG